MDPAKFKYKNKCCVPYCTDRSSKRHRFPLEPDLCQQWLRKINLPHLQQLPPNQLHKMYVCDVHFAPEDKVAGTKRGLRIDAIPTQQLSHGKFICCEIIINCVSMLWQCWNT